MKWRVTVEIEKCLWWESEQYNNKVISRSDGFMPNLLKWYRRAIAECTVTRENGCNLNIVVK